MAHGSIGECHLQFLLEHTVIFDDFAVLNFNLPGCFRVNSIGNCSAGKGLHIRSKPFQKQLVGQQILPIQVFEEYDPRGIVDDRSETILSFAEDALHLPLCGQVPTRAAIPGEITVVQKHRSPADADVHRVAVRELQVV